MNTKTHGYGWHPWRTDSQARPSSGDGGEIWIGGTSLRVRFRSLFAVEEV